MNKLSKKNLLLVGVTLFSMFFGAGNLIFPPFLGAQAGTNTWPAMFGFALSAIGLPVLGVLAVALSGGLPELSKRVGPKFSAIFTLLIYLSIGPCLAIPRTASTSFAVAVAPFAGSGLTLRVLYAFVFFTIAFIIALNPEKISSVLGRITGPLLLLLIFVIVAACIVNPIGDYGQAHDIYMENSIARGFIDGYQTMDAIAALNFGIVIAINIKNKGVTDEKSVVSTTIKAGFIAGAVLLLVYASLAHIGAMAGGSYTEAADGTQILTWISMYQFGTAGTVILGAVFFIACLNTCIGLLSCCGTYFNTLYSKISVKQWVFIFAVISFLISIAGLDMILKISVPILGMIYPVAIVLIIMGIFHEKIENLHLSYFWCVLFTGIVSVMVQLGIGTNFFVNYMPLYSMGLPWIVPAIIGFIIGAILSFIFPKRA